ncbi:MAG: hypothetical protein ACRDFX_11910 [Chloroflexota bacterium]
MGRTIVRPLNSSPRGNKARDTGVLIIIAIVVIFAIIGMVSSGVYLAGKASNSPTPAPKHTSTGNPVAIADVSRAQAAATAIVKAANDASKSIVKSGSAKARAQATSIVNAAHRQARNLIASVPTVAPALGVGTSSGTALGSGQTAAPSTSGVAPLGVPTTLPGSSAIPNLSGVPASWLVVGYNATFGGGPGSAGSISVLNRGGKTFHGTAIVKYNSGGSASASFSGLAPGQSLVLPLNGPAYPGGGYAISMSGLQ